MTTQILTPLDFGTTTQVTSRVFRKQILPVGSINYKGRRIDFSRDKLAEIEAAYRAGAFDFVPLVMADERNTHTMDPRATSGKVIDVELAEDGLDVIVQADATAAQLLEQHPEIGISARILENYERADGKQFAAAMQHALITADPRITGMRPWEAVNLSTEQVEDTVDLTAETFAEPGEQRENAMSSPFSDDEAAELRALLQLVRASEDEGEDNTADPEGEDDDDGEDGDQGALEGLDVSDAELESLALEALGEIRSEQARKSELIAASNDNPAVELANARTSELEVQLANVQRQLDERNYLTERDRLATEAGIPPAVTDLARPLLEGSAVIELSSGTEVDAGQIMRQVLAEIGKHIKLLDLSSDVVFPTDTERAEADDRKSWVTDTRKQLGL